MCQYNGGYKTRECQSYIGRILSLDRQATIGPHPTPQTHLKSSFEHFLKQFNYPVLHMDKGTDFKFTSVLLLRSVGLY